MRYEQITKGQPVIAVSRKNARGTVVRKFKSVSGTLSAPVGTEYVEVDFGGGFVGFNYPSQLIPDESA